MDKDYFLKMADKIEPATHSYIERMLNSRAVKEQSYNGSLGILRIIKELTTCKSGGELQKPWLSQSASYKTICNTLAVNLDAHDAPQ